ncbi:MAG: aminopeptidase N [Pseudomonadota bacterium]
MRTEIGTEVRLSEYKPPEYTIDAVDLTFELDHEASVVRAKLTVRRPAGTPLNTPLFLDGDSLTLVSINVNGDLIDEENITISPTGLILRNLPDAETFIVETAVRLEPSANTQLMGLYATNGNFCTQCEAEGFRRITFFPDRPDILSVYNVRIEGDAKDVPLLLSNGNKVDHGALDGGRHFAVWHDPHPKPSYLFALFAGNLGMIEDTFKTMSGRDVRLEIYVEHGKEARAAYAMDALKRSMTWDEERFGREYDLDIFMIVAVSDFNMGAMENKGLNIFNDKYVLADPVTATDQDYANIEAIIAHEYFHNWTGNRITCRDWFQLCLKEGLTVYRDHEFSADMRSRPVKRIAEVRALRAHQFPEDAGPLAHPVRPKSYMEINNFYTATVYEKGSELVRMLSIILGATGFKAGMDLYFHRHDGDAATIEDFLACFSEATGTDLTQFTNWYHYAGTPNLAVETDYDANAKTFTADITQTVRSGVKQPGDGPRHIPVVFGLIGPDGEALDYTSVDGAEVKDGCLHVRDARQTVTFHGVEREPVLSALRGFSAPVTRIPSLPHDEAQLLARHDSDPFNRWDALNTLLLRALTDATKNGINGATGVSEMAALLETIAADETLEPAYRALCLTVPGEAEIAREIGTNIDPDAVHAARRGMIKVLANQCADVFNKVYTATKPDVPFSPDAAQAGSRALRGVLLGYLAYRPDGLALAQDAYGAADNMTDRIGALTALVHANPDAQATLDALADFQNRFRREPVVLDKWLSLQATVPRHETLDSVRQLTRSQHFSWDNPNRVRALLGAFATGNPVAFNRADGEAYRFFCDAVARLDAKNPQVAARLMTAMRSWRELEPGRRERAKGALQALTSKRMSRDLSDIVSRTLDVA